MGSTELGDGTFFHMQLFTKYIYIYIYTYLSTLAIWGAALIAERASGGT
jgi:hypothetical protein